jgi:hypothetical protein
MQMAAPVGACRGAGGLVWAALLEFVRADNGGGDVGKRPVRSAKYG